MNKITFILKGAILARASTASCSGGVITYTDDMNNVVAHQNLKTQTLQIGGAHYNVADVVIDYNSTNINFD